MGTPKCSSCSFAERHVLPRNGNGNSAYVGSFRQEAFWCTHIKSPAVIFYGKTSPRSCPLRCGAHMGGGKDNA